MSAARRQPIWAPITEFILRIAVFGVYWAIALQGRRPSFAVFQQFGWTRAATVPVTVAVVFGSLKSLAVGRLAIFRVLPQGIRISNRSL
jgi:hypothetical protein